MIRRFRTDWTIMCASSWIGGKPSIKKIIKENDSESTIIVARKESTLIFILGARGNYGNVGENKSYRKDTGNGYRGEGCCTIENIIKINNKEIVDPGNGLGVDERRTLYVFK